LILSEAAGKDAYKVLTIHPLKELTIEDVPASSGSANQFHIVVAGTPQPQKMLIDAKSKEVKAEFVKRIKQQIDEVNINERVYGVPLVTLVTREKSNDGIPFLVKTTVEYLKTKKETEGLFRISGGTAEVGQLKETFNKLVEPPKTPLNLTANSAHSVAAVLKAFFRELPEPLLGFETYSKIQKIAELKETDDIAGCIAVLKSIVNGLPSANKNTMKYLAAFLSDVASRSSVNRMGLSNLAIVFGPNLLFPQEETLESILIIPKLNSVIQFLLEKHAEIFG